MAPESVVQRWAGRRPTELSLRVLRWSQVLGAVGRVVRIERCERVQLITAAARVIVSSCHDCIFYLGVNRAPLLTGDNRFIQVRRHLQEFFVLSRLSTSGDSAREFMHSGQPSSRASASVSGLGVNSKYFAWGG